jgi:hypothetical protein
VESVVRNFAKGTRDHYRCSEGRVARRAAFTSGSVADYSDNAVVPIGPGQRRSSLALSPKWAIYLTQAEHDDMGDLRVGLRVRVPASRARHTPAGARFALPEGRLPSTAVNLTQIDSPLPRRHSPRLRRQHARNRPQASTRRRVAARLVVRQPCLACVLTVRLPLADTIGHGGRVGDLGAPASTALITEPLPIDA